MAPKIDMVGVLGWGDPTTLDLCLDPSQQVGPHQAPPPAPQLAAMPRGFGLCNA